MIRVDLGDVVLYRGELARVLAISDGRHVTLEYVERSPCPACGAEPRAHFVEQSPLFQDGIAPVPTVSTDTTAR